MYIVVVYDIRSKTKAGQKTLVPAIFKKSCKANIWCPIYTIQFLKAKYRNSADAVEKGTCNPVYKRRA